MKQTTFLLKFNFLIFPSKWNLEAPFYYLKLFNYIYKQMQSTTIPQVKWAQRKDKLFLTIDAVGVKNPSIDIADNHILKFR
jgi:hypothetical protein